MAGWDRPTELKGLKGLAALAALTLLVSACSPALNWRRVPVAGAGGFAVDLPCKPDVHQRQVELPGLGAPPVAMTLMTCHSDGIQWSLSHFDAGTVARQAQAPGLLRQAQWANVAGGERPGGERRDLGPADVAGSTPHAGARHEWLSGQRPGGTAGPDGLEPVQMHVWVFVHGLRVFQASAAAPVLPPDDPRIPPFAEGFFFPR